MCAAYTNTYVTTQLCQNKICIKVEHISFKPETEQKYAFVENMVI